MRVHTATCIHMCNHRVARIHRLPYILDLFSKKIPQNYGGSLKKEAYIWAPEFLATPCHMWDTDTIQPIAFGMSFPHSQISIDDLFL